jgi:hypothetical protein
VCLYVRMRAFAVRVCVRAPVRACVQCVQCVCVRAPFNQAVRTEKYNAELTG